MDLGRMEEVYRKWERKNDKSTNNSIVSGSRQRWSDRFRDDPMAERQRRRSRKMSHPPSLDLVPELARFKIAPPPSYEPAGGQRPFMGQCCPNCSSVTREMLFDSDIPGMGFRNVLCFKKPRGGIIARYLPHIYLAYTEGVNYEYPSAGKLTNRVLGNRRVHAAIHKSAISDSEGKHNEMDEYSKELQHHAKGASHVLKDMASCISNVFLRITGWFLLKVLGMILFGVQVHQGQMEMIKRASKASVPLVIVPTHRSHLDYILMSFILYIYGIRVPFIAAGDNLNIPFFGWVMRKLGAFFIKRKLDKEIGKKDHVYRSLLHTYMEEVLRYNQNLEFFIEGGRSRSGKALAPKGGLLSVVVDAFLDGVISDAYVIPASVSYEKILDGDFTNEQMGRQKKKETFTRAVQGIWGVFTAKFGHVRVDFAEPFSLKEYLDSAQMSTSAAVSDMLVLSPVKRPRPVLKKTASDHSLYGTDVVIEDQRQLIKGLGEHIIYDAVRVHSVMSTNLIAFLLLTKHRQGVEFSMLVRDADWLKDEILSRGRDIGFSGEMTVVVNHALALIGKKLVMVQAHERRPDVIAETEPRGKTTPAAAASTVTSTSATATATSKSDEVVKDLMVIPNMSLPHVFQLSYYSNSVISIFLLESVLANALIAVANQEIHSLTAAQDDRLALSRDKVMQKATELCDLLQCEFIFVPPCGCLYSALCDTIDRLTVSEIILPEKGKDRSVSVDAKWAQRVAASSSWANNDTDNDDEEEGEEDEEDSVFRTKEERIMINTSHEQLKKLSFLQSILGPLIEGYWLTACNLIRLLDRDLPEADFSNMVNEYAKSRVAKGLAVFAESCAMDTLRNAWRLYQHWKVMDTYHDAEKVKMVHLKKLYRNEATLGHFIDKIEAFRM